MKYQPTFMNLNILSHKLVTRCQPTISSLMPTRQNFSGLDQSTVLLPWESNRLLLWLGVDSITASEHVHLLSITAWMMCAKWEARRYCLFSVFYWLQQLKRVWQSLDNSRTHICDVSSGILSRHRDGNTKVIIIIITKTIFMVLSSWQSHRESSPGSFDECGMEPSGRRPKTKPDDLGCVSACTGCQKLHPPSPFIIITQLKSWYSFYRPAEGRKLSRPSWLVTYRDGLPVHRWSPILVLTGSLRWSRPTRYH